MPEIRRARRRSIARCHISLHDTISSSSPDRAKSVLAQGTAGFADPATLHVAAIRDLSGDGNDDILFRNDQGYFYSWNMNGTAIASEGLLQGEAQWASPTASVLMPPWELV
jgi:hypothetical protein